MAYTNGRLPQSALTKVQGSIALTVKTARAWKRLKAAANSQLKRTISVAPPAGGYRSYAVQDAMRDASLGHDNAAKRRWGLSTVSTAALAAPGVSKHGLGICVDVLGTPMHNRFLVLAKKYGFTRPLAGDPNHFIHDGKTATAVTITTIKPAPKIVTVTVRSGDTLSAIAALRHLELPELLALNPSINDPDEIAVGQKIRVA